MGILFICARVVSFAANDTTRAQINNIPKKRHVIPLFKSNIIERYSIRPDSISVVDKLCLAEFAAYYYKDYRKDSDETNDAQPNVLTDEVIHTQLSILQDISLPSQITLMATKEKMKSRKVKAVIRYRTPSKTKQPERYFKYLLVLYYPWRNESDLMAADQSYASKLYEPNVQEVVELNRSVFEPNADAVTEALENLRNNQGNIHSFDPINDQENSDLQIETQNTDDTLPEESFNEQSPSDLRSSSDSSQQVSQAISTYTQPTEISDDMLRYNVRSLNEKQRSAYNIALSWCRNTRKNLYCLKPEKLDPINLFVTGGAGAGKSHLIKAIYQHLLLFAPEGLETSYIGVLAGIPNSNGGVRRCSRRGFCPLFSYSTERYIRRSCRGD